MFVRAFIQARMSSVRFPGKVLAPLWGKPVLSHVVEALESGGMERGQIVILTSREISDDPVAAYAPQLGCSLFRGSLNNVLQRFEEAARAFPSEWILRVTADSPLCSPELVSRMLAFLPSSDAALVTTTRRRTLPKGMNLEAFRPDLISRILAVPDLTEPDCEHVTAYAHRRDGAVGICGIELESADFSGWNCAVDDLIDLVHWNQEGPGGLPEVPWQTLRAAQ